MAAWISAMVAKPAAFVGAKTASGPVPDNAAATYVELILALTTAAISNEKLEWIEQIAQRWPTASILY
ncbi:hypothetical protein [Niabella hibiscisoli]|uniref:hypothetical protein n=1 Tax=Niabella hibiscisoli TaxID=1825928 RepID=UPI001F0E04BF|nr:hypothetical protein [Niabella hibiscisoli]MCH5718596.1 hypothetical protein [Niabella hibiscisoli]